MKTTPITFCDQMIQAVHAGTKTQTRRVISGNPRRGCPFGRVGDYLLLKEEIMKIKSPVDGADVVGYYSDDQPFYGDDGLVIWPYTETWLRPRDMPLHFCRTAAKIVDIKIQMLNNITEDECKMEGVSGVWAFDDAIAYDGLHYKSNFIELWNSLNAKRGVGYESNPSVWVITFEPVRL